MQTVRVELGPRSYDIAITTDDARGLGPFARQRCPGSLAFLVADENTFPIADTVSDSFAAAGFKTAGVRLPPGEGMKSLDSASLLYDQLAKLQADRKTVVVAVGGGVIGDLAGFV